MTAADRKIILAAVIMVLIGAAAVCIHGGAAARNVLVWKDGKKLLEFPASGQGFFLIDDGAAIEIRDGRVKVARNDCAGRDCIKKGWISRPGEFLICAPKRLVIGFGDSTPDANGTGGTDSVTY
jgi:hypothetical protein